MQRTEDERKRAENLVWTAAGDYGFTPDFLSFTEDGTADIYMNLVIGLMHKWLGARTEALLDEVSESRRAAILSDTLWLGIESYAYQREQPERPALKALRVQHAKAYFARLRHLNRQQWMAENKRLLDQQTIRWGRVLGKKERLLAPDRKALAAALELDPTLSAEEAAATLRMILQRYFAYRGTAERKPVHVHLHQAEAWILQHVLKVEHQYTDTLMMKNTVTAQKDAGGSALSDDKHGARQASGERAYITACFGRALYTETELRQMEARLCTAGHRGCHLYVTDGKWKNAEGIYERPTPTIAWNRAAPKKIPQARTSSEMADGCTEAKRGGFFDSETAKVRQDSAQQELANRRYFESEGELARSLVRRLSARLELTLSDLRANVTVHAKSGRLDPTRAWRLPIVQDAAVFVKERPEQELPLDVTLLLDASASRMQMQEPLAAEAWILTEALKNCYVPAAVWSFRSIRGFTVLEKMKEAEEQNSSRLFHYYAAGWNRDGLGLRLAGEELLRSGRGGRKGGGSTRTRKHILIVLTDASPDDSTRFAACGKYPLGNAYEGRAAVEDAADAIAELRSQGILVYGLFLGRTENLENLYVMYGKNQVRIHDISELARAAGEIFTKAVEEL